MHVGTDFVFTETKGDNDIKYKISTLFTEKKKCFN